MNQWLGAAGSAGMDPEDTSRRAKNDVLVVGGPQRITVTAAERQTKSNAAPEVSVRTKLGKKTEGYVTLLFFGYTFCPDQCPTHMANLGAALKKMPAGIADQVKLVFVTTDPARDTPEALRHWLNLFDRRFIGLSGTERAIESVQRAAGVPPATKTRPVNGNYAVGHANFVLAYSRDNLAHVIYPGGVSKDWVHDLPLLIKETWTRRAE